MLAELTLQGFAERIADDLPDDLAVLNPVQAPAFTPDARPGLIDIVGNLNGPDRNPGGNTDQIIGAVATNMISLAGVTAGSIYEVSFSQHYRQQLLACF
ncbi:hypothetical protein D9M69_593210 [compost metagenome]